MLPEWKRVNDSDYPSLITLIMLFNGCQYPVLDLPVVKIELLVPTDFDRYLLALVLNVEALYDLAESSFVYDFSNQIPITDMLTDLCLVVALLVGTLCEALPTVATDCIDEFKLVEL